MVGESTCSFIIVSFLCQLMGYQNTYNHSSYKNVHVHTHTQINRNTHNKALFLQRPKN